MLARARPAPSPGAHSRKDDGTHQASGAARQAGISGRGTRLLVTVPHASRPKPDNNQGTRCERKQVAAGASLPRPCAALACASLPATGRAAAGGNLPYSKSTAITSFNLDWNSLQRKAPGSDNWAATWASDGLIYTTWGDGGGFGNVRVSLGFARLSGASARTINGTNLPGNAPKGKSYGVLALGKTLYAWISPGSNAANYDEARLYAAPLGTNAWRRADWAFTKSDPARVILPTFVQAGKDYSQGAGYVYVYAPRYAPTQANRLSLQRTLAGEARSRSCARPARPT